MWWWLASNFFPGIINLNCFFNQTYELIKNIFNVSSVLTHLKAVCKIPANVIQVVVINLRQKVQMLVRIDNFQKIGNCIYFFS